MIIIKNVTTADEFLASIRRVGNIKFIQRDIYNWYDVILLRLGIKQNITVLFKDDSKKGVSNFGEFLKVWSGYSPDSKMEMDKYLGKMHVSDSYISFKYKGRKIKFAYVREPDIAGKIGLINEVFFNDEYGETPVKGKTVIDVGATIGDVATYFVMNGAKKVYCYEAHSESVRLARKSLKLNNLGEKIKFFEKFCGKGFLEQVSKEYDLSDAVLKMDVEGSEYDILLDCDVSVLRRFSYMVIEYHKGYMNLEKKLRDAGFQVSHTMPDIHEASDMCVGLIYARRKDVR